MLRWLLLLMLVVIAYRLLGGGRSRAHPRSRRARAPEHMVACSQCGVHIPASEAVAAGGLSFCNEQHRLMWQQSR